MKTSTVFLSTVVGVHGFVPLVPSFSGRVVAPSSSTATQHPLSMGLNPELAANFPRDFANVRASKLSCYCGGDSSVE